MGDVYQCGGDECLGCRVCFVPRHDHPAVDGHNCFGPGCTCRLQKEYPEAKTHDPLCEGCRWMRREVKWLRERLGAVNGRLHLIETGGHDDSE